MKPLVQQASHRHACRVTSRDAVPSTAQTAPLVLFVCTDNAARSQIALGYLRAGSRGDLIGWSAGRSPATALDPGAVAVMNEDGIDISSEFPKPWTKQVLQAADIVVTIGCADTCPIFPGKRYLDWELDDPAGQDLATVRRIRDEIKVKVEQLIKELTAVNRAEHT
jgi:protein-tyrosine-phosphatase